MLKIVGTPIGNLSDLSLRQAIAIMGADVILAENTGSAGILLQQIPEYFPDLERNPNLRVMGFHKDNEFQKLSEVLELIEQDSNLVMISEAGMPLVADPGYALVKHLVKDKIAFEVVPGPTAVDMAVVYSGFNPSQFTFLGFLPKKPNEKKKMFVTLQKNTMVMPFVFYESPFRIVETLEILEEIYPSAQVVICRELTKKFEEIIRGTPSDLKTREYKGEITVVVNLS
mgnify:CR=1 FL=1